MKITNKLNLPQPFVDAVTKDYQYQDKRYSVTSIIKGTKEAILQRRHNDEIEQDVSDMIWLIFGTAMHKVLEDAKEANDEIKESKIYIETPNGYTLSGQQDLYSESLKRITDYKSGTVWKVIYKDWDEYRMQCLVYAYMFRKLGFPCDNAEIVMVLKDWSKTKAEKDWEYPKHPVHIEHFNFTEKNFEYIEKYIKEKFEDIERCEKLSDDDIPICSEEERWAEPTKYAVMQSGRKTAAKLCDSEKEAEEYIERIIEEKRSQYYIDVREGTDKKCSGYCSCCEFCNYWRENYANDKVSESKNDI